MICPNCGTNNIDGASYCAFCKAELKSKKYNKNHLKLQFTLIVLGLFLIVGGIISFYMFYDSSKISWDTEYGDINLDITKPTTLNLHILAQDKNKNDITDIEYNVTNGKIEYEGTYVSWKLPHQKGNYTITASLSNGKKISKTVKVVESNIDVDGELSVYWKQDSDDGDGDGLNSEEEKKYGTNPNFADTDSDGLTDYYEVKISKTNPLKKDSDEDGINDGDELDLNLNPLSYSSKNDGIKDSNRELEYKINDKAGVSLEINGKGNIASSTIDIITNKKLTNDLGTLDKIYNLSTSGSINNAKLTINYSLDELQSKGLNENNLTIYYLDENTKTLEALPTTINKDRKELTANLSHFSKYMVGDKDLVKKLDKTRIMFVIDNSISMYNETQLKQAGFESSSGAEGNDVYYRRFTLSNDMIDGLNGDFEFGVAEFSGNYVNLTKFTSDKETAKKGINSMKRKWNSDGDGTNLINALKSGLSEFIDRKDSNNYLILLTDGKNTIGDFSQSKNIIITKAKNNDVKVCIIGIGTDLDTSILTDIATSTGCNYYTASNYYSLDEIFASISAEMDYGYVNTDDDAEKDALIIADSGFSPTRDGFSFDNYRSKASSNGNCFGMAAFAMLYYKHMLPTLLEARTITGRTGLLTTTSLFAQGYDLRNTYFENGNNILYNYNIKDEGLLFAMGNHPDGFWDRVENETLMIKKDYYNKLIQSGSYISFKDYKGIFKGESISRYQNAVVDTESINFSNKVNSDDKQLFTAIWRLFILQLNSSKLSFSSKPDESFERLKNELSSGTPVILGINNGHAINAIRLLQDSRNSNKFTLQVYDNNYAGQVRSIEITRTKFNKIQLNATAWSNEYEYKFLYDNNDNGEITDTTLQMSFPDIE